MSNQAGQGYTIEKLVANYRKLSNKLRNLENRVEGLEKNDKEFFAYIKTLEKLLKERGLLSQNGKLLSGKTIEVYFPITMREYKIAIEQGLKPKDIPMMSDERKIFFKILQKRGIHLPEKVIMGRLSKPKEAIVNRFAFKANVPTEFVYLGDRNLWVKFIYSCNKKERLGIIEALAKSIVPAYNMPKERMKALDLALVTVPLPAKSLSLVYL